MEQINGKERKQVVKRRKFLCCSIHFVTLFVQSNAPLFKSDMRQNCTIVTIWRTPTEKKIKHNINVVMRLEWNRFTRCVCCFCCWCCVGCLFGECQLPILSLSLSPWHSSRCCSLIFCADLVTTRVSVWVRMSCRFHLNSTGCSFLWRKEKRKRT